MISPGREATWKLLFIFCEPAVDLAGRDLAVRLVKTIAGLRSCLERYRRQSCELGLVPTMGALHAGHASLIERARAENDYLAVSIYVNPLQFGPTEDLDRYPRSLEADCQRCEALGVDLVFAPTAAEMGAIAPDPTIVQPPASLLRGLCGPWRPGHFPGVATVVTQLLNLVQPTRAYFGEKDAQQLAIIRRLSRDLKLPGEICGCPIVREPSGLAYSSRNQYLSAEESRQALALWRGLQQARQRFQAGEREALPLLAAVKDELAQAPAVTVQYVELTDPDTLQPLDRVETVGLLAIAALVGSTRLIDNVILRARRPIVAIDGPAGAGKSTVTRAVAERLGLLYLDTGAMYRAVTWLVLEAGLALDDEAGIAELVQSAEIQLLVGEPVSELRVLANGCDVTTLIRTPDVTASVSAIAKIGAVRRHLVQQQRRWGHKGGIVAEGRDIGTHVFPDAELKIFLTASVQERARRRLRDFQSLGQDAGLDLAQLEAAIATRDRLDSSRSIAPLRKAADAIEIVTDCLSATEVVERIVALYPGPPTP